MGYVGVKGGAEAILNAEKLVDHYRTRGESPPLSTLQIHHQMRHLVDKVMSEASLYSRTVAAIALKQTEGDPMEAAYLLRAFRSTVQRVLFSVPAKSAEMFLIRRISSAFQDIPGGQVLGPSRDYAQRLIRFELEKESGVSELPELNFKAVTSDGPTEKVIDFLRREGLLNTPKKDRSQTPYDITRKPIIFPLDRSARLQRLTRGEDGALLALGYASLRGWGSVHPTLAEVRVGYLPVKMIHPYWKTEVVVGRVLVTEVESICSFDKAKNTITGDITYQFTLGYGFIFGNNDRKAISMSILDRALCAKTSSSPIEDQEFVLSHIDHMESQGFISHLKLPHYVTFQSALDRIRSIQKKSSFKETDHV